MTDYELILESRYATLCNMLNKLMGAKIDKRHLSFITTEILQVESSLRYFRYDR